MGGALVILSIVVAVLVTQHNRDRPPSSSLRIPGGTPAHIRVDNSPHAGHFNLRAWLYTRRVRTAPPGATPAQLIRARRFREASRAIDPADHASRISLALVLRGPMPDLLMVARSKRLRDTKARILARWILVSAYPGEKWGFSIVQPIGIEDPGRFAYRRLQWQLAGGRLRAARRTAKALLRSVPQADVQSRTLFEHTAALAMLGQGDRAAAAAHELADTSTHLYYEELGTRLVNRIGQARHDGRKLGWVRTRAPREASLDLFRRARANGRPWPISPHDVAAIYERTRHVVSESDLDTGSIATHLKAGARVWVSVVTQLGELTALPVIAVEPNTRLVLLGNGQFFDDVTLGRCSLWGNRSIVVLRGNKSDQVGDSPSPSPAPNFRELPCPREADGRASIGPKAMRELKAAVASHPSSALAAFNYQVALDGARAANLDDYHAGVHQEFLAATAARLRGSVWPIVALTKLLEADGQDDSAALLKEGLAPQIPDQRWAGTHLEGQNDQEVDASLRESNTRKLNNTNGLIGSMERAAARGDGKDVDAHLDAIQRSGPHDPRLPRLRLMREVTWHGTAGTLRTWWPSETDPFAATMTALLAVASGSAPLIEKHLPTTTEYKNSGLAREVNIIRAMHRGSYQDVLDASRIRLREDGNSSVATDSLVLAATRLAPVGDEAIARCLKDALAQGQTTAFSVVDQLRSARNDLVLPMLRSCVPSSPDPTEWAVRLVKALLTAAADAAHKSDQAGATELAEEALAALEPLRTQRDLIPLWHPLRAGALRWIDPDKALAELVSASDIQVPFGMFLMAAAIGKQLGQDDLKERMTARAANAELITAGLAPTLGLGIDPEIDDAMARVDPALAPQFFWHWYALGGTVATTPPLPLLGANEVPDDALWRLIREGKVEQANAAHRRRWNPATVVGGIDGAVGAAADAAIRAVEGDSSALVELASTTKHPAVGIAIETCAALGIHVSVDGDATSSEGSERGA